MTGKITEGYGWLPAGASAATMAALLQGRNWYLRGSGPGSMAGMSLVTGRFGQGQRLHVQVGSFGTTSYYQCKAVGGHNSSGGYVSASLNISGLSNVPPILGAYDLVNDRVLLCASFEANGVVKVWTGGTQFAGGILVGTSEGGNWNTDADIDAECFFNVNGTAWQAEVRVNTKGMGGPTTSTPVIHLTSIAPPAGLNTYFDSVFWGVMARSAVNCDFLIGDFRYYDTAGAQNNSWLGTCRVQTQLTAGAGATTDFTVVGAATNWQGAHNQNVDDTIYNYSTTNGNYDLYTLQPLVNSPTVFWMTMVSFVRQDDATQRYYKNRISSSATIADGASYATSQTYTADEDVWEISPHTSLSFTGAEMNALQIGPLVFA